MCIGARNDGEGHKIEEKIIIKGYIIKENVD